MSLEQKFSSLLNCIERQEPSYIRIALVGQPGAGKSSLINRLVGKHVAETGISTDTTQEATEYEYRENFQKLVDLPGYGTSMFNFSAWSNRFNPEKYDIFLCVFKGKIYDDDEKLFIELKKWSEKRQRALFVVRTFSENESESSREIIRRDIIQKSCNIFDADSIHFVELGRNVSGIDSLKKAIQKTNFNRVWKERIHSAFKTERDEYLRRAYSEASDSIDSYSKAASLNGINPFPGVDVAADIGIYMKMFTAIRDKYDIENDDLRQYTIPVAKKLLELLTREGVLILIKNFASKTVAKSILKYVPFVGQATAAALGYKMAHSTGQDYNDDCQRFSREVMDKLIEEKVKSLKNITR